MSDRELTLRKSDWMGDWYVIEWAAHDGKEWTEPIDGYPNSFKFCSSSRPSDADIEGTAAEMSAIADALEGRRSASFKRCAADYDGTRFLLSSPRNSQVPAVITTKQADLLAACIRKALSDEHA